MLPSICILFCLGSSPPPPVTVTGCPRIVTRDQDWQRRLGGALPTAPREVLEMAQEWQPLRDQSRACRSAGSVKSK